MSMQRAAFVKDADVGIDDVRFHRRRNAGHPQYPPAQPVMGFAIT
ncbi:hypothetical protein [Micromonospora sp. KC723]|nr:hypothetical protein [Micromonospora sp. KC723]